MRNMFLAVAAALSAVLLHPAGPAAAAAPSTTVVTSSASPADPGQAVTLTATVSGTGTPTGTVSFEDFIVMGSPAPLGSAALVNGQASVSVSLPAGVHYITAMYGGDQAFLGSSGSITQRWGPTVAATVFAFGGPNPAPTGTPVTLSGTVVASVGAALATGSLTFSDGPTVLGSAPLGPAEFGVNGVNASASLTVSALGAGTHAITVSFPGDANLDPATSAPFSLVVGQQVATSLFLFSFPNPSTQGQTVNFGVNVNPVGPATPPPTGTVTLLEGATVLGTAQVVSGQASIAVSSLAPGSHQITASYSGDSRFAPSTSPPVTQTVLGPGGTTPVFVTLAGPALTTFGQPATVTATVTSQALGTPTGTVLFTTAGGISATIPLDAAATASFTFTPPSAGGFLVEAAYSGDATFAAGTARIPFLLNIAPMPTTTSLTASPNPATVGQPVTFTAHVTPAAAATPALSGMVTFLDGLEPMATVALDPSGAASLTTAALALGSHTVTARYELSLDYGSSSTSLVETVENPATATSVDSSVNPAATGQAIVFTASVSAASGAPTGTVTFMDGATVLASTALAGGQATFTTDALAPGHHAITAVYSGDASFQGSASPVLDQVVLVQLVTSVTLESSRNPSREGHHVRFTATVTSPLPAAVAPTGVVTFFDGDTVLGSAEVRADGTARLDVDSLEAGSHAITASYGGDAVYAPSTSDALIQLVRPRARCHCGLDDLDDEL